MIGYRYPITDDDARLCLMVMALDPDTAGDYASAPVGMVAGIARPEFGIAMYDLRCQICDAGWVGIPGDDCWWCERSARVQREYQAELLLRAPDCDPTDTSYENRMDGWAARMDIGVEAGLISRQQADAVWKRTLKRMAS